VRGFGEGAWLEEWSLGGILHGIWAFGRHLLKDKIALLLLVDNKMFDGSSFVLVDFSTLEFYARCYALI